MLAESTGLVNYASPWRMRTQPASLNNLAVSLKEFGRHGDALALVEEAVRIRRQLAQQRPDALLPDLATSVRNLANLLNGLGRHEEALASAEQSVHIYRQLAQRRPDVFLPELAQSLAVIAQVLSKDRPAEAMEPLAEAIRHLTPFFVRRPQAHAALMQTICNLYRQAAQSAAIAPDAELLAPVTAILEKLPKAPGVTLII